MRRRPALLAIGAAVYLAMVLSAAHGAPAPAPAEPKPKDYGAMAPALRLLTIETDGPEAPGTIAALSALLDSDHPVFAAQAAQTLGAWATLGDPSRALPALIHKDTLVCGIAQASYIEASGYGSAPLVVQGGVIEVPPAVLDALAELRDPQGMVRPEKALAAIQDSLRQDLRAAPETAVLAADLLARTGDAAARAAIIRLVQSSDGPVLAKAARACVRDDMGLGPTLLPVAFAGDAVCRQAVMRALVARPDPHLKSLLVRGLGDPDVAVRHNAIRAIGNLGAAAPVGELADRLTGPAAEARDAIDALGAAGGAGADALRQYIRRSPDSERLEAAAILALAPHATRDDLPWLKDRLRSPSKFLRAASSTALGKAGHPGALSDLAEAVKDPEPLVRATAAKALGQIGTPWGIQQLLAMLDDPSPLVTSMAAWGLGKANCRDAVAALRRVARRPSSDESLRARFGEVYGRPNLAAIEALGRIGGDDAVAALRESLESNSWPVRAMAAQAIGATRTPSPEAAQVLEKHLDDPVNLVRAEVFLALKALGKAPEPGRLQSR